LENHPGALGAPEALFRLRIQTNVKPLFRKWDYWRYFKGLVGKINLESWAANGVCLGSVEQFRIGRQGIQPQAVARFCSRMW
jgi:hypothetical protein